MLFSESCVLPQPHTPRPHAADPRPVIEDLFNHPLFFLPFFDVTFCLQSSSIFNPTWPHLGPQVGPYKPVFCLSFSDHLSNSISDLILEGFRTPNRCQNRSKINQKILPKSTYKPVLFQLHLQSNFEDNLMFKQNGRFSKIVPKPNVFACFLDIRSCQPKQTRDMQRIEKSPKTMSKNQLFFYRNSSYFRLFLAPISKSEI